MSTCGECVHFQKCSQLVGAKSDWKECDWIPSNFQRANTSSSGRGDTEELASIKRKFDACISALDGIAYGTRGATAEELRRYAQAFLNKLDHGDRWDCPNGDADHIKSEYKSCPVCGTPRR